MEFFRFRGVWWCCCIESTAFCVPVGLCAEVVSLEVLASVVGVVREGVGSGVDQCGAEVLWLVEGFLVLCGVWCVAALS